MNGRILLLIFILVGAVAGKFILDWSSSGRGTHSGIVDDTPDEQVIRKFELEGFGDEGEKVWELVGDWAHIQESGDVFIEKNVELTVENETKIKADKVLWKNEESSFMTRMPVAIHNAEAEITGTGALGRLDEKFIQINQGIRMLIDSGTIVTCRGPLQIHQKDSRIALYREVWILDERGAVSADRMDAFFESEDRKIVAVVARGNVRISRGEDVTFSDIAVYDTRTGSVRLEGSPEIDIRNAGSLGKYEKMIR